MLNPELVKKLIEEVRAGFDLRLNPSDPLKVTQTKVSQIKVFEALEFRLKELEEDVFR